MNIRSMLQKIGQSNPYEGFDSSGISHDIQGWADDHPYFARLIAQIKPKQIIEVGTWKGASAVRMARLALAFEPDVTVLCVDTWLGSNESMWNEPELRAMLNLKNGYPQVYKQFMANIIFEKLTDTIFPLPMTSISAAELLISNSISADFIYIDAGHGSYEVYGDIIHYWNLLRPGGIMLGDDYSPRWNGVIRAVNQFALEQKRPLEIEENKWFLTKPL